MTSTQTAMQGGTGSGLEKVIELTSVGDDHNGANGRSHLKHRRTVPVYLSDMSFNDLGDGLEGYVGVLKPEIETPGNVLYFCVVPKAREKQYSVVIFEGPPNLYTAVSKTSRIEFNQLYMLVNGTKGYFNLNLPGYESVPRKPK